MAKKYDVAAYIWPAYTGMEPRTHMFWPEKYGEWQSVKSAKPKFPGHQWPKKPLWGYVDEADRYVMEMQIEAAVDHGVNVFVYDWYWYDRRPFLEQCLNDGFLKAKNNHKMKFYLMWANHDVNHLWDKRLSSGEESDNVIWETRVNKEEFIRMTDRLIEKYFKLPNYYTIDDRPIFQFYNLPNFVKGIGGVEQAKDALDDFRVRAEKAGLKGLWLQAEPWGEPRANVSGVDGGDKSFLKEGVVDLGIDGMTHYQYVHFIDFDRDYAAITPDVVKEWNRIDKVYDMPYFAHVSLGWDNNPRHEKFMPGIMTNCTPEEIEKALRAAKEYADARPNQPPLITINSWNEWTENSYLQPDDVNGYAYLEAVRNVFCVE